MANEDLKKKAKEAGVRLWQVADVLSISDGNLSRKLRRELPEVEKQHIYQIIETIKEGAKP